MCSNHPALVQHYRLPPPSNLHDIKLTQPQRSKRTTTFCPCSCEQFCQKIRRRLPNSATPSAWANRRKSDTFQNKSRQQHSTAKEVASALGQPPHPPPKKKNGSPHPRTECSSMGGSRRHECVVCCFFLCKCVCVHEPEGIVENITLNSAMGKRMTISPCFTMRLQFRGERMNRKEHLIFWEMPPNGCGIKKIKWRRRAMGNRFGLKCFNSWGSVQLRRTSKLV